MRSVILKLKAEQLEKRLSCLKPSQNFWLKQLPKSSLCTEIDPSRSNVSISRFSKVCLTEIFLLRTLEETMVSRGTEAQLLVHKKIKYGIGSTTPNRFRCNKLLIFETLTLMAIKKV